MKVTQLIKRLKMTKKPDLQKELILQAWEECEHFFVGLQLSCDPTTRIPLTKLVQIDEDDGSGSSLTFEQFVDLYDQVTQINVTEEEARELIIDAALRSEMDEWNLFYRKILLKKLQDDLPMDVIASTLSELTGIPIVL
jgi:hypothetical protein